MIRTMWVIVVVASAAAMASAAEPKFHPAPGAMPVIGRYVVTLADSVADDLVESSVRGVAMTYNGQIEPQPSSNVRQFAISMAPSRARTLSADPRVRDVVEIPRADEAAPAAPSRADLSRHGFVPAAQDFSSSGTYLYDGAGNIKAIGSDTFVYDVVGRLKQATVQGSQQSYDYDAFGNRILTTRASNAASCVGGCEAPSTVYPQSNHLTGAGYDVAGNVISVNGAVYSYDGTGMVTRATVGSDDRRFIYTADDERIGVRNGFSWTWTVRDLSGKVLREFTSLETQSSPLVLTQHTWSKDYVWRDGLLLASVFPITPGTISPTTTYHYHLDHLGTPRLITGNDGVLVAKHTYYPFGAEMDITPHEGATELMKFTGHERDVVAAANANVDYMHARYYNGNVGRFLSVDPGTGSEGAPQSWNRYVYASNNPVGAVDRNGKWPTKVLHVHQNAIDKVLGSVLSAADRGVLKDAQATVDLDQQNQYKHAMRVPGQSAHDSAIETNNFIDANMTAAIAYQKAGKHSMALAHVGLAMHPLQDNTSPTHTGVQEYNPANGDLSPDTVRHVIGELYDPTERPYLWDNGEALDRATYDVYKYFALQTGLPVPPVPTCADSFPCFEASNTPNIHVEVPPR